MICRLKKIQFIAWHLCLLIVVLSPKALAVSPDELVLLDRARSIAGAPVEDFSMLGEPKKQRDGHYRYQLAFLSYGVCSIAEGEPELRGECRQIFLRLLEKMEYPTTIGYWKALGYEGDGITRNNVMYRGHLNLMYGLAHDRFGETRFDARFHGLSRGLSEEINRERPICCEPDHLFIQCNAVTLLSLHLHDRSFGTGYAKTGKRLLTWAREHMPLKDTTLVREDYRPSLNDSSPQRAGYANAWAISFLAPVPGLRSDARAMYADWRRVFVMPLPLYGWVRGAPAGEKSSLEETLISSLLATTFGLLAAREEGDEVLHRRLERTVLRFESITAWMQWFLPPTRRVQARTFRTIALFARTFRGWNEVLKGGSLAPPLKGQSPPNDGQQKVGSP